MASLHDRQIEVKSNDKRNFTVLPNHLIRNGCKNNFFRVLCVIASYAWEGSTCTASIETVSREAGVNRHTTIAAIKFWKECGQFSVEKVKGKGSKISTLFDFTLTSAPIGTSAQVGTTPVPRQALPPVPRRAHKEDTVKKTNEEDSIRRSAEKLKNSEIVQVFEAFLPVNPTLNYGNITQRKAASFFIETYGLEKTLKIVEASVKIQGRDYAPVIVSPYDLKEKLARLKMYFDRNNPAAKFVKIS